MYVGPSPAPNTSPKTKQKTLPAFSNLPSAEREQPGTWASTGKGPCDRRQGWGAGEDSTARYSDLGGGGRSGSQTAGYASGAAEQFGAASGTGREGGGAPPRRSQRCGAGSTTAAPPSQIPGLRPRPLAARSASPRFTTSPAANGPIGGRDERTSANQGLLTQVSLHPLPRPRLESHRPAVSPSHPAPLRGGGSQLRSSPGCSGGAGRGGGVCHLVTLILASSQTRLSSLSQSSW
ncbi:unnamed protein product [Rangifer tarandus platyrhynchus]|uniref:Uncharacterized protein n=3 Tax=Rangifer tarandus platyrhynchus TaxID=3082113 RepID=A0AC59Y8L5_RANTA|nr:unnamed protein product [Rangifer tarandus platyrhynchus]CAI9713449.1 unnamed protein product [Rangifer tarandus platyrhynchus]